MYKRCVTEQSARRQREMENGLLFAMGTHQYEDITISDLCAWLDIPRKSFYRYFSSKEGALYALIDHTLMDFADSFPTISRDATYAPLVRFFSFWSEHKPLLDALGRNDLFGTLIHRTVTLASTEPTFTKNLFSEYSKLTQEYVIIFLVSGLMSLVVRWHQTGFEYTPGQMADIAAVLLSNPIVSNAHTDIR